MGGTSNKNLSEFELKESCFKLIEVEENIIVYIMTMPDRYEKLSNIVREWKEDRIKLCPKTEDILDASALVKNCDVLVSVDTGIVHVGSAFNVPTISIFSNNDNSITYFSPISDLSYIIKNEDKHYIKDFDKKLMCKYIREILNNKQNI